MTLHLGMTSAAIGLRNRQVVYPKDRLPWHMALSTSTGNLAFLWDKRKNAFGNKPPVVEGQVSLGGGAQSMDGSNGHLAVAIGFSSTGRLTVYDLETQSTVLLSNVTGIARFVSYSPDGKFLLLGYDAAPYIRVYERDGDTYSQIQTAPVWYPSANPLYMSMNDGIWISDTEFLVGWRELTGSTISLFKIEETTSGYEIVDTEAFGGLSTDGTEYPMVVSSSPTQYLSMFNISELDNAVFCRTLVTGRLDAVRLTTDGVDYPVTDLPGVDYPAGLSLITCLGVSGKWMVAGVSSGPGYDFNVVVWERTSEGWELYGGYSPDVTSTEPPPPPPLPGFPDAVPNDVSFSSDGKTLALAVSGYPRYILYSVSDEGFTPYEDHADPVTSNATGVKLITKGG